MDPLRKPLSISPFAFRVRTLRRRLASAWAALPELVRAGLIAIPLGAVVFAWLVVL